MQVQGIVRDIELRRRHLAEVLQLCNKNSVLKKLLAVAHVEDSRVIAREQDNWRIFGNCHPLLRAPCHDNIAPMPLGIALVTLRFLFGSSKPLDYRGLEVAAGDTCADVT